MAAVCANSVHNTIYQTIGASIIGGCNGSFHCFPDNGKTMLFADPQNLIGPCSSNFINGLFFGGSSEACFVPQQMSVKIIVLSTKPTLVNGNSEAGGEVCLAYNPEDGAVCFLLAWLLIQTGQLSLYVKRHAEICVQFDMLPQAGGMYTELAGVTSSPRTANPNCVPPLWFYGQNGSPDMDMFHFPQPICITNTAPVTAEATFEQLKDGEEACFTAADVAACTGGEIDTGCLGTHANVCSSVIAETHGIMTKVDLLIHGLACVSLC